MKSFFEGVVVAVMGALAVLGLLSWLQTREKPFEDLPIIAELTNTYQQGWAAVTEMAGRVMIDAVLTRPASSAPVTDDVAAAPPRGAPFQLKTSWHRAAVLEKLARDGFSRGRLRSAEKYLDYIDRYKADALNNMYVSGVSASITLAQGILESGAGQSKLARKTNNHFGIKAWHRPSAREKIRQGRLHAIVDADFGFVAPAVSVSRFKDDYSYDRFEVYPSVRHSYQRHSDLLTRPCKKARKGCYAWIWRQFPVSEEAQDITAAAETFQPASGIAPERFFKGKTRVSYFAAQAAGLKMAGYATSPTYHQKLAYLIDTYDLWRLDFDLQRARDAR